MVKQNGKKTILVIDDDKHILIALEQGLGRAGYQVINAINGLEALKLLESTDYDLIITDIDIPYVSGIGVISALKKKYPNIPSVAITGFGEEPLKAAKEEGADVVINKPFEMSALIAHIEKLLD